MSLSRSGQRTGNGVSRTNNSLDFPDSSMKEWIRDTLGLGVLFWLIGYIASMVLFFTPLAGSMGWIITAIFTPVTVVITWWWFRERDLRLPYYAGVGVAWMILAVVLDYLFIVLLFHTSYYSPDVFLYYALTLLIPVLVGAFLIFKRRRLLQAGNG